MTIFAMAKIAQAKEMIGKDKCMMVHKEKQAHVLFLYFN